MQYRQYGKVDFRVSALGFGTMRLPTLGDDARIDEPEAIRMIRHAIDRGVNYIDAAYVYHGGNCEGLVGKALRDGYRDRVKIATKLLINPKTTYADFDHIFDEQRRRLQTDRIDFYLLHAMRRSRWETARSLGYLKWAERAVADGRIGHLGFSFHDDIEGFKLIVDAYDGWEMCQLQYNFLDENYQAGVEGVRYAASKGLAVVIMEPLLGGRLADPPARIRELWDRAPRRRKPAEWALQWLWNQPEISTVLSGMSTMDQVAENLASADRSAVGQLTTEELALFQSVRDAYRQIYPIPCTACRYCMPCPHGVDIPDNLEMLNRGVGIPEMEASRFRYRWWEQSAVAAACTSCRECEDKCPQGIPIADWMPIVADVLGKNADFDPSSAPGRR